MAQNFYCEYCGTIYSSIGALTGGACIKHPDGPNKGKHKLYEGGEKSDYFCKYCGNKYHTIASLTNGHCIKHPNGPNKGYHSPAL
ncbi:hypothetical protein Bint_1832 [Brachyspira intermedia PWS/A]|uniref:C2H2-type domain-containing protein n=1 Tax=Brachyspira intermedia (strain ATCC 51140 / PWS/A) TaxID=1045858 RepID=G0EJQ2_BRAIP|nr:hypothetical protein [Brachyspira intermedia]AEM22448.1 hypothetical protein Bint_1832 [Brachyspira intermedia PWS/A]